MSLPLVSIVSPCFNVAPYIERFLDSLINQTYKHLEIILVNDGATDKTGNIITSYIPKLRDEGYEVRYIIQENQGLACTINNGIKYATGKYLTWPDPDDCLTNDSIEKRVHFLESHPNTALVRSNIELIDETSGISEGTYESINQPAHIITDFFEKLLFSQTWYAPIGYMVRMSYFDKVVKDREIYASKRSGQNLQLLLPLAHSFECWQLPTIGGFYFLRGNSHSHSKKSYEDVLEIQRDWEETQRNTLISIAPANCTLLIQEVNKRGTWARLELAKQHKKIFDIWKFSFELNTLTSGFIPKIRIILSAIKSCISI